MRSARSAAASASGYSDERPVCDAAAYCAAARSLHAFASFGVRSAASRSLAMASIGRSAGLHHVYAGNLPGQVGDLEDTRCRACAEPLIMRYGYLIRDYRITPDGRCPACATKVPGRFGPTYAGQLTSRPFVRSGRLRTL